MIRSFKEIKKELEKRRLKQNPLRDAEGRVVVDIRILNDDEFLSPYSAENHNIVSEEASSFIEHSLQAVPVEEPLHFRVHSDVITAEEQKEYTKAIHEYYEDCYVSTAFEKKRLTFMALIMALVGVAALTLMIGLDVTGNKTAIALEVIDIFAWVFLWEAVDIFFLQGALLRFKQKRYLALADCIVEYLPLKEEEHA